MVVDGEARGLGPQPGEWPGGGGLQAGSGEQAAGWGALCCRRGLGLGNWVRVEISLRSQSPSGPMCVSACPPARAPRLPAAAHKRVQQRPHLSRRGVGGRPLGGHELSQALLAELTARLQLAVKANTVSNASATASPIVVVTGAQAGPPAPAPSAGHAPQAWGGAPAVQTPAPNS